MLPEDGESVEVPVRVCDDLPALAEKLDKVFLRVILFGAVEGDSIEATLNGVPLTLSDADPAWKDKLIFSPKPQPPSGGADYLKVNPKQRLLRLDFVVEAQHGKLGRNAVTLRGAEGGKGLSPCALRIRFRGQCGVKRSIPHCQSETRRAVCQTAIQRVDVWGRLPGRLHRCCRPT